MSACSSTDQNDALAINPTQLSEDISSPSDNTDQTLITQVSVRSPPTLTVTEFPSSTIDLVATRTRSAEMAMTITDYRDIIQYNGNLTHLEVSPDGTKVVTGGRDGSVIIWDYQTGERVLTLVEPCEQSCPISSVDWKYYTDKQLSLVAAATNSDERQIIVFNAVSGEVLASLPPTGTGEIFRVRFSPDGNYLAVAQSDSNGPMIWSMGDFSTPYQFPIDDIENYSDSTLDVSWSPSGKQLAIANGAVNILIWGIIENTIEVVPIHAMIDGFVTILEWSSEEDGLLLTADVMLDTYPLLFDIQTKEVFTVYYHLNGTSDISFSADGRFFAIARNNEVLVIDANTKLPVYELVIPGFFVFEIQWLPSSNSILITSVPIDGPSQILEFTLN